MSTRKKRRKSGGKWSDALTKQAKQEGYGARSVYKLKEMDRRFGAVGRKGPVLDLGCAPGAWSRFVRERIGKKGRLVGVDLQEVLDYPGVFLQGSITEMEPATLLNELGGRAALVLSDMAPFTTGNRFTDHVRQIELAGLALDVAIAVLQPGGTFVVKVFDGEEVPGFAARLRGHFDKQRRVRPEATRTKSVEFFLVCQGFKPADSATNS